MRLFITGGAGFIGSNFVHYILREHTEDSVVNYDKLTYAGNLANLKDVEKNSRYTFVQGDIADIDAVRKSVPDDCDAIVNFAADTHVDRSILDPEAFLKTDIFGTRVLLEVAKEKKLDRYVQVSTDEVYGDIEAGQFFEGNGQASPIQPILCLKGSRGLMVLAYVRTYEVPAIITRCTNNLGYQTSTPRSSYH